MNENWPEIVETVVPYLDRDATAEQFLMAVKTVMVILGWRHTNGSMSTGRRFSSNGTDVTADIVLSDKSAGRGGNALLPVMVAAPSGCFDGSARDRLRALMNAAGSWAAVYFGRDIRIFLAAGEPDGIALAMRAEYEPGDASGARICDLLSYKDFSMERLCTECGRACIDVARLDLRKRISVVLSDDRVLKELLAAMLGQEGFERSDIDVELRELAVSFEYRGQKGKIGGRSGARTVRGDNGGGTAGHDSCRFSLDGGRTFMNKRRFVLAVVRRYAAEHPDATFDDLERQFPSSLLSRERGVVRPLATVREWMRTNPDVGRRYCIRPDEIITLHDGMEVAVHNQWGERFPRFLRVAVQLYDVRSDKPYPGFESLCRDGGKDAAAAGGAAGICIPYSSLTDFRNRNR